MGGSVKQGQPGHSCHHWEGKPTGLPGKMSPVWLPLLSCSTFTATGGAGFASQLGLPHSGVSPDSFSGAEMRLSTGSQSGWCHPALYSHSQALFSLLSHLPLHLLEGSSPSSAAEDGVWLGHEALQTTGWFQEKISRGAAHTEPTGVSVWGKVSDELQAGWDPGLSRTRGGSPLF